MLRGKFIHVGVILLTVAFTRSAGASDRELVSLHLVTAAQQALSAKSARDPLRSELELLANGNEPHGTFCVFLSTRAQLAVLPFLSLEDLLTLIKLDSADLRSFQRTIPMNPLSAEALEFSLYRIKAIAMYAIDQVETREQWREVSAVIRQTRSLLKTIVKRDVYRSVNLPSVDQARAEDLIRAGRKVSNPGLILLGEAARNFSKDQSARQAEILDEEMTTKIRTQLLNMISMLETRLFFIGDTLEVTRIDHLRVGVRSLCERLLN